MAKETILKVNVNCEKCKRDILKAVTKLEGVDQIVVDGEKGTVAVIGEVDPVSIVKNLRKAKRTAEIISVGPPKPPEAKPAEKKPDETKPVVVKELPPCCHHCDLVAFAYVPSYGREYAGCTVL